MRRHDSSCDPAHPAAWLDIPGGRINQEQLSFVADSILKYNIDKVHFTTCQTIQLHNLNAATVCALASAALDYGILTRGGGGDFPRNVMVSPLSGTESGEYFDVYPYAKAASDYLLSLIGTMKLPRKLKVGFSNSPANLTHVTFRDLGFAAREDGTFDVYSAGGLGNHPKMGVLVAQAVPGSEILYYIKAMVKLFTTYGNYENRGKARTRYMQDTLGENYVPAFREKLEEARQEEDLTISVTFPAVTKASDGVLPENPRILPQKQEGLYTVIYHPVGGCPAPSKLCELRDAMKEMPQTELRLAPDETLYVVHCTAREAQKLLSITSDSAGTPFEASVACIGASICQIGVRDSQKLLHTLVEASRTWNFQEETLPKIHISGCPSSCGTHQIGQIGFRGGAKKVDGVSQPAFVLFVNGSDLQGQEQFGEQVGTLTEAQIPLFLKDLGSQIEETSLTYGQWIAKYPTRIREIAAPYVK